MQVIPSINVKTFEEAKRLIEKAAEFADWVHIDVADGVFTANVSWGNAEEFRVILSEVKDLRDSSPPLAGDQNDLRVEVHLMVENPEAQIKSWLEAGVKRIILHSERVKEWDGLIKIYEEQGVELGVVFSLETNILDSRFLILDSRVNFFQILAVKPGLAGQKFLPEALEKIKLLRQIRPNAIIEVDGGINLETAKLVKEAGANVIVSANYIWSNSEPKKAFEELQGV